jgi:hypothetical protein
MQNFSLPDVVLGLDANCAGDQNILKNFKIDYEFKVTQSVERTGTVHFKMSVNRNEDNSPLALLPLQTLTSILTPAAGRITTTPH